MAILAPSLVLLNNSDRAEEGEVDDRLVLHFLDFGELLLQQLESLLLGKFIFIIIAVVFLFLFCGLLAFLSLFPLLALLLLLVFIDLLCKGHVHWNVICLPEVARDRDL